MTTDTCICPYEGEAAMLQALVDTGLTLRLASNNPPFKRGLTAKAFTEAVFPGYEAIRLAGSLWTVTEGSGKTPSSASAPFQLFLRTSGGDTVPIYCWYLTTKAGKVVAAEKFPLDAGQPWEVRRDRDAIEVKPVLMMPVGE